MSTETIGNARAYMHDIVNGFKAIGYEPQVFKLNAASMGVPQKRERVFVIARRSELKLPKLVLQFNEPAIPFGAIEDQVAVKIGKPVSDVVFPYWKKCIPGKPLSKVHEKGHYFNSYKVARNQVVVTVAANDGARVMHHSYPNRISDECLQLIGSFPLDYNFLDVWPQYLIGMSVPPVMTAQIAHQVYLQWLSKL